MSTSSTAQVHVLKTAPATLRHDVARLLATSAGASLDPVRRTWIKINGNFNILYPGSNTSAWFLDALLHSLRQRGFKDLTCVEGNLPEFSAESMIATTGLSTILAKHDVPFRSYERDERDEFEIPKTLRDVQLINTPVFHTHGQAIISCATKNLFGILPWDRRRHHGTLSAKLIELYQQLPCVTFVDGTVGLEGESTRRGNPVRCDLLLAGTDALALDVVAAQVMGFGVDRVPLLASAAARGILPSPVIVGDVDSTTLPVHNFGLKVSTVRHIANALTHVPYDLSRLYKVTDKLRVALHKVNFRVRQPRLASGPWVEYAREAGVPAL